MSDYTPTKLEVRSQYANDSFGPDEYLANVAEFDRWLEAHNAEVVEATEERIIKLLEERYAENVDHCEWGTHLFLDNAIALIKGEK